MRLTKEEIANMTPHPTNGLPESVHITLGPNAGGRKIVIKEIERARELMARGDFEVLKSFDQGTISFRGTYMALRGYKFSVPSAAIRAAWKKLINILEKRRV